MDRIDTKIHLVFDLDDKSKLNSQFEAMFIAADHESYSSSTYDSDNIKQRFPEVYKLYRLICFR